MAKRMKLSGDRGFTFLETIMALAITAMTALFALGFIRPQIKLYNDYDRLSQAKAICSRAYVELEKVLRYGYEYYVDPECPEKLAYYVPKAWTDEPIQGDGRDRDDSLPSVDRWPCVSAESLEVNGMGDMSLKLDFKGTSAREARAAIMVMEEDEPVYEQEIVIRSMYGDQVGGVVWYGR